MSSEYEKLVEVETTRLLEHYDNCEGEELQKDLSKNEFGHLPLTCQTRRLLIKKLAQKVVDSVTKDDPIQHVVTDKEESSLRNEEKSDLSLSESSVSTDDENKTHYVICIPGTDNQILIENDRLEVLKKMKDHTRKKPRMLMFPNYTEAAAFAKTASANDVCQGAIVKTSYPKEKAERDVNESVPFPSIGVPQSNQLRLLLEKGNVGLARQLILHNPRYLISNGDVPMILKIGPRYNALHSCAFAGQLESCKLIMELLCDIEFLKTMYGTQQQAESHSKRLVDLYLNTPDKLAHKTPLHFASEKGFVEIVAFLVSFRVCNRTALHKEMACDKYKGSDKAEVKRRIQSLIKDGTCYVPLVRSDTTGPYAKVVTPFSPSSPHHLVEEIEESLKPSPLDNSQDMKDFSNLKLWAVAGPMSPQEAQEFRRDWWSPRAVRKEIHPREPFLNITDGERGFEHYGRKLADSHNVPWQEYWPFLDAFVDMRSLEGLKRLEAHLSKQTVIIKYGGFKAQTAPSHSEPLQVSKDFVMETEEAQTNEDSDSFVSATDFDTIAGHRRVQKRQTSTESDDAEGSAFHDCKESISEADKKAEESKDRHESSFQKLWNGVIKVKDLFSPGRKKSVSEPCSSSREVSKVTSSSSSPPPSSTSPSSSSSLSSIDSHSPAHKNVSDISEHLTDKQSKGSSGDKLTSDINSESSSVKNNGEEITSELKDSKDETSSTSSNSVNQVLELSSVCETSTVKSSGDQDQKLSTVCESSIGTGNVSSAVKQLNAPLTSTPVKEWTYRNSIPIINSPEEDLNVTGETSAFDTDEGKEKQDLEKDPSSPHTESAGTSVSQEGDESFRNKMSFLCHGLENFKMQSPPYSSPADTCIVDCPEEVKDKTDSPRVPCLQIFSELNVSQLIRTIESKLLKPDGGVKRTVNPVLMLKQAADSSEECVLADVYLPLGSVPRDVGLVMDDTVQKELHENVWLNFLVSFPSWFDATSFAGLHGSETVDVGMIGTPSDRSDLIEGEKQFDLQRLKEAYFNVREPETESVSNECCISKLQCKVVRSSTILSKDIYICGTIPTKIDGDVYRALNDKAIKLIDDTKELSAVNKWLSKMKINGKDIDSLPSPARVLRSTLQRQGSLPLSPLVKNERPVKNQTFVQSPCSSKRPNKDIIIRNLFPTK